MTKKLTLALLVTLMMPSPPASAGEFELDTQVGIIVGPVLRGFVGGELSVGMKRQNWNATLQGFSVMIGSHPDLSLVGWVSAVPLMPDETLSWSPLLGLMHTFNLSPSVQGGLIWPRPVLGFTLQKAWGPTWIRFTPNVMLETIGTPNAGMPFWNSSLLGGPPLFEVGYQFTPTAGLSLRTSITAPLKVFMRF